MIRFITYSNDLYAETRDFCGKMAKLRGKVDSVRLYKPEDIDEEFRRKYGHILDIKAGNGLWLWKPYFVCRELEEANDNDIVLYCDAGSFFFRDCRYIVNSMDDDIWVSNIPLIEKQFTKPELFEEMKCEGKEFTDTNQIQGNFVAIRKTERGVRFANEWLEICCSGENLSRETRFLENNPTDFQFIGHRSDQSVLSLLTKKWRIKAHMDPSQYGRVPEKYYAPDRLFMKTGNQKEFNVCIILHRGRRPDLKTCINQWVCTWLPLWLLYSISTPCKQVKSIKAQGG